jgi:hypothetical protein
MRRSFKAAAIWRRLFPSAFMGRMSGRTLAANWAAAALLLATPLPQPILNLYAVYTLTVQQLPGVRS